MRPIARTNLVLVTIACLSVGVFAIVISTRHQERSSLQKSSSATKRISSSRRSRGEPAANDEGGLSKSLRLRRSGSLDLSLAGNTQEPKAQASKLSPDVVSMVGPVSQDRDLRDLPYIPVTPQEEEEERLMRHPPKPGTEPGAQDPIQPSKESGASTNMAAPLQTFAGMTQNLGCGNCLPPDTDGDVGPNHYMQAVNSSIRVHDKTGNVLAGPVTYNSFFSALGSGTPCGNNQNGGDGIVFYDHLADRWVVSDFAFPAFPGAGPFYQCIGVSKTSNPVTGGYWLYAVLVDATNIGDYPKFGLWPDAYYMSVNLFSGANSSFQGVRMFALDRAAMINGGSASTIAFTIGPADLGDSYSFVPASFRTGLPPPVGQPEWFMDINSSAAGGTVENQVFVRRFHVDFVTPINSVFGVGATHAPDGIITVNNFVDAFDNTGATTIVPNGTATATQFLDTLGDKLMYPLIYQNLAGVESIYSSHSVNNNQAGTGPVAIRWYQFNMTGNTIPATPAQQQTFNNGADGLWRWMPSINVDWQGNMSIGYSASSTTVDPGIRYAGRLATDPPNTLTQGEAVMTPGTGHQTSTSDRWGDYSSLFVDPTDGCTFFHTNEYYSATSSSAWNTRVGSFKFPTCTASPLPTPSPSPSPTPTATPTPPVSAGPVTVTATAGTLGPTDYATVKAAFDAINAGTHQGAINIFIIGDTSEAAAAVLNASGGSSSYTSITMQPSGGAARTVSGNLALPLLDLNGADFVTIDGLNSGGNSLTISNTSNSATANTSTIRFINGASNDIVKNCSILGSATAALGAAGGNVLFSTTTGVAVGSGNNNNTITGNNIGPAGANLPIKSISALGTAGNNTVNLNNNIDNNNIFDFFGTGAASVTGIDIRAGNNNWIISSNRIYQTAPRAFTGAALRYAGITFSGTTGLNGNFHTISGNTIGFAAANGTGTTIITGNDNEVRGIDLQGANSSTATSVQGNIISAFNQTSSRNSTTTGLAAFAGIQISNAAGASATGIFDVGNLTGNTIGSLDGASTIVINASSVTASTTPLFGILDFSGSSNNVSNNQIGAISIQGAGTVTGFRGIFAGATAATTHTINNNIIGGAVAGGAITDTQVGSYSLYGIQTSTAAFSVNGNTIRNLNGNSNGAALVISSGIVMSSASTTNVSNISRNTISNLTNASGAASNSIYGMDVTMSTSAVVTANLVERNFIHSLSITSTDTTSQLYGIIMRGQGTGTFQNNMIRLGVDAAGNSITSGYLIRGFRDVAASTSSSYYFNSVYIGGTGVTSASNTQAFFSDAVTNTHNFRDNIFWNARSNASGTGKNYAIAVGGTAPNPPGLTTNFNDLYATGTGGFVGLFNAVDQPALSDWQTATGQDANSLSTDPKFVARDAAAASVNLHILTGSPVVMAATAIASVTNDFDNDARPVLRGDTGADQITSPTAANGSIRGTITDGYGVPVAGVTISLNGMESRETITDSNGNYSFENVGANGFYVLSPALVNFHFSPTSRWFSLLGSRTDAWFTAAPDAAPIGNAIDTNEYFVRQQYLDFLSREADPEGFAYWTGKLDQCNGDAACLREGRIDVSAAFFRSREFQEGGSYVYRLYEGALGRQLSYNEFAADRQQVVGGANLEASKVTFTSAFANRAEFLQKYQANATAASFVDALLQTLWDSTHVDVSSERANLINRYNSGSTMNESRALVLQDVADNAAFSSAVYNRSFVLMEYLGYLRRGAEPQGYAFWLNVLNTSDAGNYRGMVCSFLTSMEYQRRFGTVVTHSNSECADLR